MRVAFRVVLVKYTVPVNCEVSKEMDALVRLMRCNQFYNQLEMQSQPASSAECALWLSDLNIAQKRVHMYMRGIMHGRQPPIQSFMQMGTCGGHVSRAQSGKPQENFCDYFFTAREQWRSNF
jgi:hypothetical protein